MVRQHIWIGVFALLVISGCRKDKDGTAPSISILSPDQGTVFSIPDTIVVRFTVSDDRVVESTVVQLIDANGVSIAPSINTSVGGPGGTFVNELIINSERILTGQYEIMVRASDGTNDSRAFRTIQIQGTPLRLRSIFVAPPPTTATATVQRIDSTGQLSDWTTVQDLNGAAIDGYSQHVMLAGSQFAPFQALPTDTWSYAWSYLPPANDAPEQFTALVVDPFDGQTYFATRDGFIRGFTGEGAQRFTAQTLTGYRCYAVTVLGDRIATWQRAIAQPDQRVVTYTVSGTILDILPVGQELVELYQWSNTSAHLFANDFGHGKVIDLYISTGGSQEIRVFQNEEIRAVARMDPSTFFIAMQDRIVAYDRSANTVVQLITGVMASAMAYEPATGALLVAQGNDLLTIDPRTGALMNSISTGAPIGSILPLRNR